MNLSPKQPRKSILTSEGSQRNRKNTRISFSNVSEKEILVEKPKEKGINKFKNNFLIVIYLIIYLLKQKLF